MYLFIHLFGLITYVYSVAQQVNNIFPTMDPTHVLLLLAMSSLVVQLTGKNRPKMMSSVEPY